MLCTNECSAFQRITVYEEKMKLLNEQSSGGNKSTSESAVSNEMLQGQIVDLKSQLNALRNENVKLKEGLAKAKQAGQQYKQLADSAEKQVRLNRQTLKKKDKLVSPF